ncbi:GGDEF domain-containing protein [Deltaproteobacteria bacterium OttesenSCG-928-M10]|nr:GGDEF domain-containing protein [Deltaproteobacteria bacterium OttesenSCG-928-M10]
MNSLNEVLESQDNFLHIYDIIRLVAPQRGELLEYDHSSGIKKTGVSCIDVFGTDERCQNCTSIRAFYSGKTMVKLEYSKGKVLLVISVPVTVNDCQVVAELVKDISDSMTVDIRDHSRVDKVTGVIQSLNKLATTDALTGLFNRRYLDEKMPEIIEDCHKNGQHMCCALLDIDNFKQVNDTYGHPVGDQVLAATSHTIASYIRRSSDMAVRYGGEEFFMLFVGVDLTTGRNVLERVCRQIEQTPIKIDGHTLSVTVSIGLAELFPDENAKELLTRCDKLLYRAKKNGKNRVEC